MIRMPAALVALSSLTACAAQVGVHEAIELPRDSAVRCALQCDHIDLEFEGVAIVGNSVACLCAPRGAVEARQGLRQQGAVHALVAEDQGDDGPTLP